MRVSVSSVNIGYYCSYYSYAYRTVFYTVLEYELVPSMDSMHSSYTCILVLEWIPYGLHFVYTYELVLCILLVVRARKYIRHTRLEVYVATSSMHYYLFFHPPACVTISYSRVLCNKYSRVLQNDY